VRRSNLAGRLLSEGRYADSLTEYAWCYDHSDEGQRVAAEFRASQALRGMARVGAHYPPALDAVRERRTRVEANLKARPNEPEALSRLIEVNRVGPTEMAVYRALKPWRRRLAALPTARRGA